jgi:hypothetical protein
MNNGVMQSVSRQRIGTHVPAATNTDTTIELLLETVFSSRYVQSGYKEDNWGGPVSIPCGGGVEYLHRSPAGRRTPWLVVRKRTIPTERPPLVSEVSANFLRIEGCRVVSATDPHGR